MQLSTKTLVQLAACTAAVSAAVVPVVQHKGNLYPTTPPTTRSAIFKYGVIGKKWFQPVNNTDRPPPNCTYTLSFSGEKTNNILIPHEDDFISAVAEPAVVKRQVLTVMGVATFIGNEIASDIISIAITEAYNAIRGAIMEGWNAKRKKFTEKTTEKMWLHNPDWNLYPAAICYNKQYEMTNGTGYLAKGSAKLRWGLLFTDYDCFYMKKPNKFMTGGDNGDINLHYFYDSKFCIPDTETGHLDCKDTPVEGECKA